MSWLREPYDAYFGDISLVDLTGQECDNDGEDDEVEVVDVEAPSCSSVVKSLRAFRKNRKC